MFTEQEDNIILDSIKKVGEDWEEISDRFLPQRTPKQIRDRFMNYLRSGLKSEPWTKEEDDTLLEMFNEIGPKWSKMKAKLPGRSGNDIKNRWHKHLFRNVLQKIALNNYSVLSKPEFDYETYGKKLTKQITDNYSDNYSDNYLKLQIPQKNTIVYQSSTPNLPVKSLPAKTQPAKRLPKNNKDHKKSKKASTIQPLVKISTVPPLLNNNNSRKLPEPKEILYPPAIQPEINIKDYEIPENPQIYQVENKDTEKNPESSNQEDSMPSFFSNDEFNILNPFDDFNINVNSGNSIFDPNSLLSASFHDDFEITSLVNDFKFPNTDFPLI